MSRPLNEYPKEELEDLLGELEFANFFPGGESLPKWINRVKEAISDRELADKELPFKTTEQK